MTGQMAWPEPTSELCGPLARAASRKQLRAWRSFLRGKISGAECERRYEAQRVIIQRYWDAEHAINR